jgi:ubiquinone biosynthesis protein
MSEEVGVKVTSAAPPLREKLAERIVEALIAVPLFAEEENSFFHADPHAGNLFADEDTGDLIILDWALREYLSREQRRQTVLLALAVALRDEERVVEAISLLSEDDFEENGLLADFTRGHVTAFFKALPALKMPGFVEVSTLLDGLAFGGVRFPAELLMFRKVMFTLEGVLNDLDPALKLDLVLGRYALKLMGREIPQRLIRPLTDSSRTFRTHLSNYDLTLLVLSLPLLGNRLWLHTAEKFTVKGLDELQRAIARLIPSSS